MGEVMYVLKDAMAFEQRVLVNFSKKRMRDE